MDPHIRLVLHKTHGFAGDPKKAYICHHIETDRTYYIHIHSIENEKTDIETKNTHENDEIQPIDLEVLYNVMINEVKYIFILFFI
jgi:hypothetical protein